MSTKLRVLGRVRLSRSSEESTSVERQREIISQWADANGHTVIGWAEDIDVSGSVDPFDSPRLGDWLTNRHPEFDVIAAWKLDRLSRSTVNLNRLVVWCHDHDKTLVSATEGIDISTPIGRLITSVISFLAEGELEAIRERNRGSRAKLRELARWPGGKPPFGYQAVKNPEGGWRLEVDPHAAGIVARIVRGYLDGSSLTSIARTLTAEGVPTPAQYYRRRNAPEAPAGEWHITPLRKMLTSPALRGRLHHNGTVVRDDEGQPAQVGPPLVTDDEWSRIQARFAANQEGRRGTRQAQASPLSGLVSCLGPCSHLRARQECPDGCPGTCGQPMHFDVTTPKRGDKKYRFTYYRCRGNCGSPKIRAEELEALAEETFLAELGDSEVRERVWVPGDSHEAELREALAALDELSEAAGKMTSQTARTRLQSQLVAIDARIAELEQAPAQEARWEYRAVCSGSCPPSCKGHGPEHTGQKYRDVWEVATPEGRRDLLGKAGITFSAQAVGGRGSKALKFRVNYSKALGALGVPVTESPSSRGPS